MADLHRTLGPPTDIEKMAGKMSDNVTWYRLRYDLRRFEPRRTTDDRYIEFWVSPPRGLKSTCYQLHDVGPQSLLCDRLRNGGIWRVDIFRTGISTERGPSAEERGLVKCEKVFQNVPKEEELLEALGLLTSVEGVKVPEGPSWGVRFHDALGGRARGRVLGIIRLPADGRFASIDNTALERVEELRKWFEATNACR